MPEAGQLWIEVRGGPGAILRLAEGAWNQQRPGPNGTGSLVGQVDLDARTRKRFDLLLVT